MSEIAALPVVRHGALAVAALAALVLLLIFHSVVAGAVQRAAQRRSEAAATMLSMSSARPSDRARPAYFPAPRVSLARASD